MNPPVQTGYGPMKPSKPGATTLTVCFLRDSAIHSIEPVESNAANYPEHTILLSLDRHSTVSQVQAVVDPPVSDQVNRILIAVRPEDARSLAHHISRLADSLDQDQDADSPPNAEEE